VVSATLWCWNWSQEKNHCYCQERRGGRTVTQVFLLLGGSLVCWFLNIYFIFSTLMCATTKYLFEIVVAVAIQSVFRLEIYQNDIFFIFKKLFF
jgi:hypothetical protein